MHAIEELSSGAIAPASVSLPFELTISAAAKPGTRILARRVCYDSELEAVFE